ncbi:MAG: pilus assembly protein PilY, partial [Proteobacteria bacterium]|nr:pilus assembly protein PilY [Pseudomonadota bacterium]
MRNGVLGDIVDSSPTWVGPPSLPYKGPWRDALYPATTMPEGTSYTTFASSNATRTNVVYVGGNDGFMHGFRAGAYLANGQFDTTGSIAPNDGTELIGYMPSSALATIHSTNSYTDFSSPSYSHVLSVDATPGTGDLYYNGAWHTWLVGGMGGGGNTNGPIGDNTTTATGGDIFALDITNPGNFSEANAGSVVIGDWGPNGATISCVGNTPANCGNNLGNTYGTPIVRRLHDGNWGVIFGNGLNSATGTAGIYIMEVSSTGAIAFRFLDTGYGPSKDPLSASNKNGIAYVSSADLDGDHVTDYVYAGDRFGNLWRFDLTSNNAASWAVTSGGPLFSTPGGQPITTRVTVTSSLTGNNPGRVMIDFGTGQQLPQTLTGPAIYASGTQTIYGIWDWNMSAWNALGSAQYVSVTAPQTITTAKLQTQTATDVAGSNGSISGYRTVTQNKICWAGSATCSPSTSNTQFGWQLALPDSGEQIIYNPTTAYGLFVVNTTIPAVNQALSCSNQPPTGYTMAIAADTGGAPSSSFFASATNNYVSANGAIVAGIGLSAVGTPSFVSAMTKPYMVNQTSTGVGAVTQVNAGANGIGQRLNWIKLR